MAYCAKCGCYVKDGNCPYYHKNFGSNRFDQHPGDCGFVEGWKTIGFVLVFLYLSAGFLLSAFTFMLSILNY